ncbi:DNA polymerase III subunit alpha [Anaerobiospirillum thomasii]|uniref:DNA polymerase III subunit alpha n=1 Tax=Anaerobiospirillum thomasii TaxID=179995 RepID=UPI000D9B375C|nr:DNA polymerase III subunit alpha [Anaerobiospirillum thomasii]SPT72215.1 DNA polymerase III subunit alpha [Anaerobiospirillum thomasii]
MTTNSYIPLHIHSYYSIQDGLEGVEDFVKRAAKLKIPALAITDISNICGFIKFYSCCKANGIKPIMGADIEVIDDKGIGGVKHTHRLTLLAMNRQGKQNLYDILSDAWLRSDAGAFNASTSYDDLSKYSEGIIVLNGFRGDIAYNLQHGLNKEALSLVEFYKKNFSDRFCFEITRTGREGESEFEEQALNLCLEHGICPVASNDTVFIYGEKDIGEDGFSDYDIHDVRVSIQKGVQRGNKDIARLYSKEQYLKSPQEMAELFYDLPEAIENSRAIAQRCNVEIELDHPRLPHYPTGDLSPAECLRQKSYEGLEERLNFLFPDPKEREEKRPVYVERLEVELDVIITMDFPGYFLIVMEFIQWSKDHNVPVGPGRGSGGGSLVAYALKITDFDPLRFDLLFERFLNPERVSMPDFDIDFCQRNREKTLEHVKSRYGIDAVSQIATFGTMAPKAAIKDTGRALGMPYGAVDRVAKLLPAVPGLSFKAAMGIDKKGNPCDPAAPDFVKLYNQALQSDDKQRVDLIRIAMRLEGVIRNIGKHAAGVVISPTRTAEFTPLMLDSDGNSITQFDKKDVEHAGLVKFDFLGLTTLTIIADALEMINAKKKRLGQPPLDIHAVPFEDDASFKVIQDCQTTAVFQLESSGMRKLIGQMQPDRFDDLIALVALYRPGPIKSGMVEHFVNRKHGREEVSYPHPDFEDLDLKPILDSTYGVIVYQEQVMQIAQVLAGYSLGGADILRRAMGKKNPAEMAGQRSVFREGAISKGKDPEIAMKIFDQVEMFAEYGFNKSHSAAYALVAWWTLYLKTHHPAEFLAAMMTADRQKTDKLVNYISDCYRLKIKVNPPDVTIGNFDFTVNEEGAVVYGLGAVKGIGFDLVERIVHERNIKPFTDYFDFVQRVGTQRLNKRTLEALIVSGALDCFGVQRATLNASIPVALKYAAKQDNDAQSGQVDLFAAIDDPQTRPLMVTSRDWSDKYRLNLEKQVLGLYLSGHPINSYKAELQKHCRSSIASVMHSISHKTVPVIFSGVVIDYSERISKKDGSKFYFMMLDDSTSQLEITLYSKNAQDFGEILEKRRVLYNKVVSELKNGSTYVQSPLVLIVEGNASLGDDGQIRVRVSKMTQLETIRRQMARSLLITTTQKDFDNNIADFTAFISRYRLDRSQIELQKQQALKNGESLHEIVEGCTLKIMLDDTLIHLSGVNYRLDPTDDLIDGIRDLFGSKSVRLTY